MAHICAKILRKYTLSRSTTRAARNKVQVCYIEIIVIEIVTIWLGGPKCETGLT